MNRFIVKEIPQERYGTGIRSGQLGSGDVFIRDAWCPEERLKVPFNLFAVPVADCQLVRPFP